ncbi:hypothetical protein G6O67_001845 [Ophiocordyceps sinensis]|uniref:Uncharacterized protein n=1 Tax=Ophiocordyceps sinensis TaxID=72228 RepID=A0A8H4PT29_9HYPO|nr:hypothetical protein G6O67_001845 [Ophiocordyceps sinensis]
MTSEALVARLVDPLDELTESVILIHAARHYICFLQFDISQDYLDDLNSPTPTEFLHVSSTPWFDLCSKSGRQHLVSNICGLVRWAKRNSDLA